MKIKCILVDVGNKVISRANEISRTNNKAGKQKNKNKQKQTHGPDAPVGISVSVILEVS